MRDRPTSPTLATPRLVSKIFEDLMSCRRGRAGSGGAHVGRLQRPALAVAASHGQCTQAAPGNTATHHVHNAVRVQPVEGRCHLPRNPAAVPPEAKQALAIPAPQPQHAAQVAACRPIEGGRQHRVQGSWGGAGRLARQKAALQSRSQLARRTVAQLHHKNPSRPIQSHAVERHLGKGKPQGAAHRGQAGAGGRRQARGRASTRTGWRRRSSRRCSQCAGAAECC